MGPFEIAFIKAVVVAVVAAGTGLTWYSLRLRHASRLRPDADRDEESRERTLFEARIAELEERVDFMERRFTQTRSEPARIEPRIPTPV